MKLSNFHEKSYSHQREGLNRVQAIYINNLMRTLAFAIGGLFSPLYIFFLGFEDGGLIAGLRVVILAIVIERVTVALLSLPMGRLVYRLGLKWSILLGSALLSVYFLLPSIFPRSLGLIVVMSLLAAFEILIYWLARLSLFSIDGERSKYGQEVSFMAITDRLVSVLGPFVGGYLVATGGFQTLFLIVTLVSVVSAVPMFFVGNREIKDGITFSGLKKFIADRENAHLNISFIGQGVNSAIDGFFWPVFIFFILKSYELLGGVSSVVTALSIVMVYLAGKKFDRLRAIKDDADERMFSKMTVWLSLLTGLRPLFGNIAAIIGHNLVYSLSAPFWWIPYDSYLYSAGKRQVSPLAFFAYREVVYSIGRVGTALLLFFALPFVPTNLIWWVVFGISAVGLYFSSTIKKES